MGETHLINKEPVTHNDHAMVEWKRRNHSRSNVSMWLSACLIRNGSALGIEVQCEHEDCQQSMRELD